MQISAANLILAAQQPAARTQGAGFAAVLSGGQAPQTANAARFAPPDLTAETKEPPAPEASQEPSSAQANRMQTGYAALAAPGSQLDIRV